MVRKGLSDIQNKPHESYWGGGETFQVKGTARTKSLRNEQLGVYVEQQGNQGSWSSEGEGVKWMRRGVRERRGQIPGGFMAQIRSLSFILSMMGSSWTVLNNMICC